MSFLVFPQNRCFLVAAQLWVCTHALSSSAPGFPQLCEARLKVLTCFFVSLLLLCLYCLFSFFLPFFFSFSLTFLHCIYTRSASSGEGSPTKIDYRKKCTLVLTSLLEDLVYIYMCLSFLPSFFPSFLLCFLSFLVFSCLGFLASLCSLCLCSLLLCYSVSFACFLACTKPVARRLPFCSFGIPVTCHQQIYEHECQLRAIWWTSEFCGDECPPATLHVVFSIKNSPSPRPHFALFSLLAGPFV